MINTTISSTAQLIDIINKYEIENGIENLSSIKAITSIVYDPKTRRFYRIKWAINAQNKIWYESKMVQVFYMENQGVPSWLTKKEIVDLKNKPKNENYFDIDNYYFSNIDKNNILKAEPKLIYDDYINFVGFGAGKGKSSYCLIKSLEHLLKNKKVLYFSTDETKSEIISKFINILKNVENIDITSNALTTVLENLIIIDYDLIDVNFIINKMREIKAANVELEFIVVDHLKTNVFSEKPLNDNILKIYKTIDQEAYNLKCEVLITTQINNSKYDSKHVNIPY